MADRMYPPYSRDFYKQIDREIKGDSCKMKDHNKIKKDVFEELMEIKADLESAMNTIDYLLYPNEK